MTLEKIIEKFSDEELEICFREIQEWRQTGVLQMESLIRKAWEEFKLNVPTYPIHAMPEHILYEIAARKFR